MRREESQQSIAWRGWGWGAPDGHQMNKLWRPPFCRIGSPTTPLSHPLLYSTPPPLSSLLTVQFPSLASLLLPANCDWSLIMGPPHQTPPSPRNRCVWEETGMSKCYQRQKTARDLEVTHNKTGCSSACRGTELLKAGSPKKNKIYILFLTCMLTKKRFTNILSALSFLSLIWRIGYSEQW